MVFVVSYLKVLTILPFYRYIIYPTSPISFPLFLSFSLIAFFKFFCLNDKTADREEAALHQVYREDAPIFYQRLLWLSGTVLLAKLFTFLPIYSCRRRSDVFTSSYSLFIFALVCVYIFIFCLSSAKAHRWSCGLKYHLFLFSRQPIE